jgi:hypothetical protein
MRGLGFFIASIFLLSLGNGVAYSMRVPWLALVFHWGIRCWIAWDALNCAREYIPPLEEMQCRVSASIGQRRRWAAYRTVGAALWLGVAGLLLWWASGIFSGAIESWASGRNCRDIVFWGVLFTGLSAAAAIHAVRGMARVRLYLRGRGRPFAPDLEREISSVCSGAIAAAVCGLFYVLFVPKFQGLAAGADRGATLGNLGAMRSALSIYYGDTEGNYPFHISELTRDGRYLSSIPKAKIRAKGRVHKDSNRVRYGKSPTDEGGWLYNNESTDPNYGTLIVNCTHTDYRGNVWSTY